MNYVFNDAVLRKKEILYEINRIYLLIINSKGQILIFDKDEKKTLPFLDFYKDGKTVDNGINSDLLQQLLNNKESFISIDDYQYKYQSFNGYSYNILVHANCYLINQDDIEIENCRYTHLFEINHYLDTHADERNHYYYYDNRILSTILDEYFQNNSELFYDPNYYKNYLLSYYYYDSENTKLAKLKKEEYVRNFVGDEVINEICNDTREYISNLVDHINIVNSDYANLTFEKVFGQKNSSKDWYADILGTYYDKNGEEKYISSFIIKNILGRDFKIFLTNQYEQFKDDSNHVIGDFVGLPMLYIKGNTDKLIDIIIRENNNNQLILNKKSAS